ncbi:hypothetical protein D3C84_727060 [compost metagenome]
MGGEGVQGHVADHPQLREAVTQGADGPLGDAVRVPRFGAVEGLLLQRRHREQCQRRNAQCHPGFGFLEQQVDGQALDAGHRGYGFAAVLAVQHEHRKDQVVDGQDVLAHQAAGEIVTAVAAQAGGGEQAIGGGKAHSRLQGPEWTQCDKYKRRL